MQTYSTDQKHLGRNHGHAFGPQIRPGETTVKNFKSMSDIPIGSGDARCIFIAHLFPLDSQVGLKSDLKGSGVECVRDEQAEQFADEIGAAFHAQCSARDDEGVIKLFDRIFTLELNQKMKPSLFNKKKKKKKKNKKKRKKPQKRTGENPHHTGCCIM